MAKLFETTSQQFIDDSSSAAREDKHSAVAHIFERLYIIQNQLESMEARVRGSGDVQTAEMLLVDPRPEWSSPEALRALRAQYIKYGHVISSHDEPFTMQGVFMFSPCELIAQAASAIHSAFRTPEVVEKQMTPRMFRNGIQLTAVFEMLVQALSVYRPNGGSTIEISLAGAKHLKADYPHLLSLRCEGAQINHKLTVQRIAEICREIEAGNWRQWRALGTRLVALLTAISRVGGELRPLAVRGDEFLFEVLIPVGVAAVP